jgi:hypothetical protein
LTEGKLCACALNIFFDEIFEAMRETNAPDGVLTVDQPPLDSAGQPEPPALVLNEPSCYHFRVLDPAFFRDLSATSDAVTIGSCSHF